MAIYGEQRIEVRPDGTARVLGIDFSNGNKPIVIWKRTREYLVLKTPTGSAWAGNFSAPRDIVPAAFHVFRIVTDGETEVVGEYLIDFPLRQSKE